MQRSRLTVGLLCALAAIFFGTRGPAGQAGQAIRAVQAQAPPAAQTTAAGQGQTPPPEQTAQAGRAGQAGGRASGPLIDAQHLRMPAEARDPHATVQVFGSQSADGYYIVGQHFAPHQTSRPHYHDKDRWVTVISGTWYTGEGDVFRPETMVPLKPGSVMFHPAGLHHYDGSMGDEEVQLLIAGYGPVTTVQTEVDAQGNPVRAGGGGNRGRGTAAGQQAAPPAGR